MSLLPPGETSRVLASRVLVLAPHYDDEVLGCGGLLATLSSSGAEVRVLFLSDSSGGCEEIADREAYAATRRQESEAAGRELGIAASEHLGLRDGALEQEREAIVTAVKQALLGQRPDLVLVPSPLEVTADHRATFAALQALVSDLREGEPLAEITSGMRLLLYEVNQPAYPDLLVDVSGEVGRLEAAMSHYRSQQRRHDYLGAALGLRRYRTLSLGTEVTAAEGYRQLEPDDLATRSPAQLIAHLGGAPQLLTVRTGPLVSIVVRTRDRPQLLREALDSLSASTYRRLEVVVVNDGGSPVTLPESLPFATQLLELGENRGRAGAAQAGVEAATGEYIGFLDDDDLVAPEHVATLVDLVSAADVEVAYTDAAVGVYELGGGDGWRLKERRLPYSRDFDRELLLLDNYIPFNTLLIARPRFVDVGPFDASLPLLEDWDFLIRLAQLVPFHHLKRVTCEYRHFHGGDHHALAGEVRERSGFLVEFLRVKARVLAKHADALTPELLARAIDRFRLEQVGLVEAATSARHERSRLEETKRELEADRLSSEDRYHRLNGEVTALRTERQRLEGVVKERDAELHQLEREARRLEREVSRLAAETERLQGEERRLNDEEGRLREQLEERSSELGRLYEEEKKLRSVVEDQSDHLARTYAEIERLNREIEQLKVVIDLLERSRGLRLQRFVERALGRRS